MIIDLIKGKDRKTWRLEDRINFINDTIESNQFKSLEEINSLSRCISYLKYSSKKGSLKKAILDKKRDLNYENINSLILKIENYRLNKYELNIENNMFVNEINEIYHNKKLNNKKFYYLNNRLEKINEKIDKIESNKCSLKDIDSLNYILISMNNDSYMKQKSKKDKKFEELKKSVETKIKNVINNSQIELNKKLKNYENDNLNKNFESKIYSKIKKTYNLGKFAFFTFLSSLAFTTYSMFSDVNKNENYIKNEKRINYNNQDTTKTKDTFNLIDYMKNNFNENLRK